MTGKDLHEAVDELGATTPDLHRALVSLQEELEAIDWYQQRIDAARDPALRAVLAHNRDEEKEHAAMLLEWLRRHDAVLERELRDRLFTAGDIAAEQQPPAVTAAAADDGSLGIGSLRQEGGGA
jgi:ferritin-like protein